MNSTQYVPDADFAPAPAGTRVRLATLLSVVVVFIATAVSVVITVRDPKLPSHLRFIVSGLIPAAFALTCFTARIRRYRLVGDQLRIELPFRTVRFPLAGLVSAVPDREALRGSWKVGGNDGLVVISGRFRSKRLGAFRAYLTDVEHAVVLRWPDRCVVISPYQHSYFIETIRKRAGLFR